MPLLRDAIHTHMPQMLLVHSKGASIAYELARLGIWRGHTTLSSPIINPSQTLSEDDYEGMGVVLNDSSRIDIALGMEEDAIIMEGGLGDVAARYAWQVHWFHGGHWWWKDELNAMRASNIFKGLLAKR